ncbi:MAG: bifunctional ornithine acetyltransferase/N-acetylglutamate synthase, partial [Phycisphaerae bacterium]|nr:bifunctional ornithine acetyltransferase/N-acetylglutamate synthase [Phycisphaerae bacterium]
MAKTRHITTPKGFVAAGAACGLKAGGKKDLAIIAGRRDAAAAIVTTQNQVVGAAITWCRKVLPQGHGRVRGIVINAGNANTCTGRRGERDAARMAAATAKQLGTSVEKILVASTGVIGETLPIAEIRNGIAAAGGKLGKGNDRAALEAIMTTDTVEKSAIAKIRVGGRPVTVAGVVKGSGMIGPNMATMIAVLTTDA